MSDAFPLPPGYLEKKFAREHPTPKPPRPPKPPEQKSLVSHGRFRPLEKEMSSDMITNLLKIDDVKGFLEKSSPRDKSRMTALLFTLYPASKVGLMVGLSSKQVRRCYHKHEEELKSAMQARNQMIAGMAERRAVETLQSLDVTKIPDERKPRALKDLMDSAVLANQNIKPPEEKKDITVRELLFRITERKSSTTPKPPDLEEGNIIDAEFDEQKIRDFEMNVSNA